MELERLEDLLLLLEGRSIIRAALRRQVTYPAATRRIRQLDQGLAADLPAAIAGSIPR